MNQMLNRFTTILLTILVPLIIITTTIRLLLGPAFIQLVYAYPNFPQNYLGYTQVERYEYALKALTYLKSDNNPEVAIQSLDDQNYTQRELGHLVDVKYRLDLLKSINQVSLLTFILLVLFLIVRKKQSIIFESLKKGSLITLYLSLLTIVFIAIFWKTSFIGFHQIFFPPYTWSFPTNSTLIRLFPEIFWQITFASFFGLTLLLSLITWLISRLALKKHFLQE